MSTLLSRPIIALLRAYQLIVSPWLGQRCRYHPSCSQYAIDAVRIHGLAGLPLAGWRLLRCNPFSRGGYDPVKDRS